MKTFLLIAGANYYPETGDGDWIGLFETIEEAKKEISEEDGYSKTYKIKGVSCDWFRIIDLKDWGLYN